MCGKEPCICASTLRFTLHGQAADSGANEGALLGRVQAYLSPLCWLGVAMSGRSIAFVP
jgi:hypothetical protein